MKAMIFPLILLIPSLVFSQITEPKLFPFTDPTVKEAHPVVINPQKIMMTYVLNDTLRYSISNDDGSSWASPEKIFRTRSLKSFSALRTNTGRIIIIWTDAASLWKIISDNEGIDWYSSQISGSFLNFLNFTLSQTEDNTLWLTMSRAGDVYVMKSIDDGQSWSNPVKLASYYKDFLSITSTGTGKLIASYQDNSSGNNDIFIISSTDNGNSWSSPIAVASTNLSEEKPRLITTGLNTIYLIYQVQKPTPFSGFNQYDIHYLKTTDGGNSWQPSNQFTRFVDDDILLGAYKYNDKPFINFFSKRYSGERLNQIYFGIIEETLDNTPPPTIYKFEHSTQRLGTPLSVRVYALDDTTISDVKILLYDGNIIDLFDDGLHNDSLAGDFIYGNIINPESFNVDNCLFVNNIQMPLINHGVLADVNVKLPLTALVLDIHNKSIDYTKVLNFGAGGRLDDKIFLFSGGFMLSGYNGSFLWANGVATASRIHDYQAGVVGSNPADPKNKLYVVKKTDIPFGTSWQNWRDAVSLGAYFYDGDNDGIYNPVDKNGNGLWDPDEDMPDILGDETIWCVYNDGVPANQRRFSDVPPQGIEIRQTVFASNKPQLDNTIFIRYSILNKGTVTNVLDSVYFSVWTDPDIGDYTNDLSGSDTLLYSGYTYNNGSDYDYGSNPPAFFTTLLQGPWIYTGNASDTAFNNRGQLLGKQILVNHKNLSISSFLRYFPSTPQDLAEPTNRYETRYYTLGLNRRGLLIDPCTFPFTQVVGGINCATVNPLFFCSGDPVTNIGWIMTQGSDVRMMLNVGPFQLQANSPVDIIVAYTVGRGSDHLNSITVARNLVSVVLNEYRSNFGTITGLDDEQSINVIKDFLLYQNYPNPFNSSTKIKYQVAKAVNVTLKVYDLLGREVAILVNEEKKPGVYEVEFNGSGLSSGVYFYKLNAGDFTQTKKLMLLK